MIPDFRLHASGHSGLQTIQVLNKIIISLSSFPPSAEETGFFLPNKRRAREEKLKFDQEDSSSDNKASLN